jgi:hypothetical protein
MISQELNLDARPMFWMDSMPVIRYIANEITRCNTYVAKRVSLIGDYTKCEQWRYVDSKANPADIASRGADVDGLRKGVPWIHGPKCLNESESKWPEQPKVIEISDKDPATLLL